MTKTSAPASRAWSMRLPPAPPQTATVLIVASEVASDTESAGCAWEYLADSRSERVQRRCGGEPSDASKPGFGIERRGVLNAEDRGESVVNATISDVGVRVRAEEPDVGADQVMDDRALPTVADAVHGRQEQWVVRHNQVGLPLERLHNDSRMRVHREQHLLYAGVEASADQTNCVPLFGQLWRVLRVECRDDVAQHQRVARQCGRYSARFV